MMKSSIQLEKKKPKIIANKLANLEVGREYCEQDFSAPLEANLGLIKAVNEEYLCVLKGEEIKTMYTKKKSHTERQMAQKQI